MKRTQLTLLKPEPEPIRYAGKPVERGRVALAESVLQEFNGRTGGRRAAYKGSGAPSDALTRILGAVLAWPDLELADWGDVIDRALAEPWWRGRPSVGVVFGPKVVEQYIFPAAPIESAESRKAREDRERRLRQRAAIQRVKEGFGDNGSMGQHLPAS